MLKTGIKGLDSYCEGVRSGEIPVCRYVKQAVDRHYRDLERAENDPDFPYYFEKKAAIHFFEFCASLNQYEGEFAGKPIILEPCQQFWFGSIFGWLDRETKFRRYRECHIEIPKKNGKSLIGAAIALYGLEWDNEPGAQIYNLGTNRSHVMKLSYRAAERIVKNTPELASKFVINRGMATMGIRYEENDSIFEPLTSKPSSLDGFNVHMFIADETKDWESDNVWNLLDDGTISRRQPLALGITTAGSNRSSLGYEKRDYLTKVLSETHIDERFFGIIYTIDEGDEDHWDQEWVWKKANPLYGVSVQKDYFEKKISKCRESASAKVDFLIKHLNRWIHAYNAWMDMNKWGACEKPSLSMKDFEGQPCYIFFDLASKKDLASLGVLFRHGKTKNGKDRYFYDVINFLPKSVVEQELVGRKAPYNGWAEAKLVILTPGNTTDYDEIESKAQELTQQFKVIRAGFDPWNAYHLITNIEKHRVKTVEISQNVRHLSEPMKTLEAWVEEEQLIHNGNPVLKWAMGNITAREDKNENVFPVKEHPDNKIDPAVALINLVAMELTDPLPKTRRRRKPVIMKV